MEQDFAWSSESPFCVGLGPLFGKQAAYLYSDMQFAKQTARHFWQLAQVESDEFREEGTLDPRLHLDLKYNIDTSYESVVDFSEIKLVYSDWLNQKTAINLRYYPLAHGDIRKFYEDDEKSRDWTAVKRTSSLQTVYFDSNGNFAGIDWHEYSRSDERSYQRSTNDSYDIKNIAK